MKTNRVILLALALLSVTLVQNAQAFYNPTTGRWLSRDPIGENGGHNLFAFVANAPIGVVDTDGRQLSPPLCNTCGQVALPGHRCVPTPPPTPPDPTGFAICRRGFESDGSITDGIVTGVGNLAGGKHTYVHYKECEKCPTQGWGFSGGGPRPNPDKEKAFKPNDCKPCNRTDSTLKNGSGKSKKGTDATDAEIEDCIKNSPIVKQYSNTIKNRYVCSNWANQATSECGLSCK